LNQLVQGGWAYLSFPFGKYSLLDRSLCTCQRVPNKSAGIMCNFYNNVINKYQFFGQFIFATLQSGKTPVTDEAVAGFEPSNLGLLANCPTLRANSMCSTCLVGWSVMRKEFLSRINWIYYWILFCTTHKQYNCSIKFNWKHVYKR